VAQQQEQPAAALGNGDDSSATPDDGGLMRTYSLAEVAAAVLPPEMKNPQLWLVRRLRRGEIQGYKAGRYWRMTAHDVEALRRSTTSLPRVRALICSSIRAG
jgi:hypothetical protein